MKEEKCPHTRKPLRGWRLREAEWGSLGAAEESTATGVRRAKRTDSSAEDRGRPALTSREACLLARRGGWGWELRLRLLSERRDRTEVGGVNTACVGAPRLAGRESGEGSGPAEEARDFYVPLCFLVHEGGIKNAA